MEFKLYTARFFNKNLKAHPGAKIRISRGYPQGAARFGWPLNCSIEGLMPSKELLAGAKAGRVTKEEYEAQYRKQLQGFGADTIQVGFESLCEELGVRALILLCFEDLREPGKWCHRCMFAQWWQEQTGQAVFEIPEVVTEKPFTAPDIQTEMFIEVA
jgi:hypothetical protein